VQQLPGLFGAAVIPVPGLLGQSPNAADFLCLGIATCVARLREDVDIEGTLPSPVASIGTSIY
jgi:hypothetical protein